MNRSDFVARSALASLLAVGVAGAAAAGPAERPAGSEKCAGIAKAGKNDCATKSNSCAGQVKADSVKDAWLYLPKGACERIVGATLVMNDKS
jgi:uncharacterized membrane protein